MTTPQRSLSPVDEPSTPFKAATSQTGPFKTDQRSGSELSPKTPRRRPPKGALLSVMAGVALLLVLFAFGLVLIPRFQAANPPTPLQRSDADRVELNDLYLDLTLVTPSFLVSRKLERNLGDRDPASVLPILVGLNTHTGTIEHMHHLPDRLSMVGPDGYRYPSLGEPIVLSQHHNAYLVLFPALDHAGERFLDQQSGTLTVEARDVGRQPLRSFEWQLPVHDIDGTFGAAGWATRLALIVALLAALLVVLSPCALELSLYYSAIISCTITDGERSALAYAGGSPASGLAAAGPLAEGRKRVIRNLLSFVAGFTLLYAVSGATVGLIGQGVRKPLGQYADLLQVFGGLLILYFALRVAGVDRWLTSLLRRIKPRPQPIPAQATAVSGVGGGLLHGAKPAAHGPLARLSAAPGEFLGRLRKRGQARVREGHVMRPRDSFLVGMGLSSACVTCMGGAVLYPLLVYAGITSWYSGLVTLTLYSLGIALPMMVIALGFVEIRLTMARKVGFHRALRAVSATMLAGIGLMILLGYERIITDVAFGFMASVAKWASGTAAFL